MGSSSTRSSSSDSVSGIDPFHAVAPLLEAVGVGLLDLPAGAAPRLDAKDDGADPALKRRATAPQPLARLMGLMG